MPVAHLHRGGPSRQAVSSAGRACLRRISNSFMNLNLRLCARECNEPACFPTNQRPPTTVCVSSSVSRTGFGPHGVCTVGTRGDRSAQQCPLTGTGIAVSSSRRHTAGKYHRRLPKAAAARYPSFVSKARAIRISQRQARLLFALDATASGRRAGQRRDACTVNSMTPPTPGIAIQLVITGVLTNFTSNWLTGG